MNGTPQNTKDNAPPCAASGAYSMSSSSEYSFHGGACKTRDSIHECAAETDNRRVDQDAKQGQSKRTMLSRNAAPPGAPLLSAEASLLESPFSSPAAAPPPVTQAGLCLTQWDF